MTAITRRNEGGSPPVVRGPKGRRAATRIIPAILAVFAMFAPFARAQQLDQFILDKFDWKMSRADFDKEFGEEQGFEWVSSAKEAARHSGRKMELAEVKDASASEKEKEKEEESESEDEDEDEDEDGGTKKTKRTYVTVRPKIGKMEVGETIVRFKDDNISRVDISVFNRGDDRPLDKEAFEKKVEDFKKLITKISGSRPEERRSKNTAVRAKGYQWKGKTTTYLLEYSTSKVENFGGREFLGEYINLKVAPMVKRSLLESVAERDKRVTRSRDSLPANVVKDPKNGDVNIEGIPMVDQGAKGYCAVASAERVLRYYGLEVDQHQMAQIAESTAGGGTSPDKMTEALKNVAGRLKVHLRTLDEIEDYKDFEKMVKNYNRYAKRNKKNVIPIRPNYYLNFAGCFMAFDAESLKESRLRDFDRFFKTVKERVDEGVPLLWSLFLGVYPEENIPQPTGGHMRLITGYNEKTGEIIYSDSWGAGHEKKRMDAKNAYAMTTGVRILLPFR